MDCSLKESNKSNTLVKEISENLAKNLKKNEGKSFKEDCSKNSQNTYTDSSENSNFILQPNPHSQEEINVSRSVDYPSQAQIISNVSLPNVNYYSPVVSNAQSIMRPLMTTQPPMYSPILQQHYILPHDSPSGVEALAASASDLIFKESASHLGEKQNGSPSKINSDYSKSGSSYTYGSLPWYTSCAEYAAKSNHFHDQRIAFEEYMKRYREEVNARNKESGGNLQLSSQNSSVNQPLSSSSSYIHADPFESSWNRNESQSSSVTDAVATSSSKAKSYTNTTLSNPALNYYENNLNRARHFDYQGISSGQLASFFSYMQPYHVDATYECNKELDVEAFHTPDSQSFISAKTEAVAVAGGSTISTQKECENVVANELSDLRKSDSNNSFNSKNNSDLNVKQTEKHSQSSENSFSQTQFESNQLDTSHLPPLPNSSFPHAKLTSTSTSTQDTCSSSLTSDKHSTLLSAQSNVSPAPDISDASKQLVYSCQSTQQRCDASENSYSKQATTSELPYSNSISNGTSSNCHSSAIDSGNENYANLAANKQSKLDAKSSKIHTKVNMSQNSANNIVTEATSAVNSYYCLLCSTGVNSQVNCMIDALYTMPSKVSVSDKLSLILGFPLPVEILPSLHICPKCFHLINEIDFLEHLLKARHRELNVLVETMFQKNGIHVNPYKRYHRSPQYSYQHKNSNHPTSQSYSNCHMPLHYQNEYQIPSFYSMYNPNQSFLTPAGHHFHQQQHSQPSHHYLSAEQMYNSSNQNFSQKHNSHNISNFDSTNTTHSHMSTTLNQQLPNTRADQTTGIPENHVSAPHSHSLQTLHDSHPCQSSEINRTEKHIQSTTHTSFSLKSRDKTLGENCPNSSSQEGDLLNSLNPSSLDSSYLQMQQRYNSSICEHSSICGSDPVKNIGSPNYTQLNDNQVSEKSVINHTNDRQYHHESTANSHSQIDRGEGNTSQYNSINQACNQPSVRTSIHSDPTCISKENTITHIKENTMNLIDPKYIRPRLKHETSVFLSDNTQNYNCSETSVQTCDAALAKQAEFIFHPASYSDQILTGSKVTSSLPLLLPNESQNSDDTLIMNLDTKEKISSIGNDNFLLENGANLNLILPDNPEQFMQHPMSVLLNEHFEEFATDSNLCPRSVEKSKSNENSTLEQPATKNVSQQSQNLRNESWTNCTVSSEANTCPVRASTSECHVSSNPASVCQPVPEVNVSNPMSVHPDCKIDIEECDNIIENLSESNKKTASFSNKENCDSSNEKSMEYENSITGIPYDLQNVFFLPSPPPPPSGPRESLRNVQVATEYHKPTLLGKSIKMKKHAKLQICRQCDQVFSNRHALIRHIERRHKTYASGFTCTTCHKKFNNERTLIQHTRSHKSYSCKICSKIFPRKVKLKKHMEEHNSNSCCEICGKKTGSTQALIAHHKTHTKKLQEFICKTCSKKFTCKRNLQQHELIHTGANPFSCSNCQKNFRYRSNMIHHLSICTKKYNYVCDVCGKGFALQSLYKRHLENHEGKYAHSCSVCDKGFDSPFDLKRHFDIHSSSYDANNLACKTCKESKGCNSVKIKNERNKRCHLCSASYFHQSNLSFHIKNIHLLKKSNTCSICGKQFSKPGNYRLHMNTHSGQRPYSCSICGKLFTSSSNQKRHMKCHAQKVDPLLTV